MRSQIAIGLSELFVAATPVNLRREIPNDETLQKSIKPLPSASRQEMLCFNGKTSYKNSYPRVLLDSSSQANTSRGH